MRKIALALCLAIAWAAAARGEEARLGRPVMGTILDITVTAENGDLARRLAEDSIEAARRWDDVLTIWRPEGELAALNAHAGRGLLRVTPDLAFALRRMLLGERSTAGAFNPAVAGLVRTWSRAGEPSAAEPRVRAPFRLARVLSLRGRSAALARGAALDPGGIGKGIALDAIAELLSRGGIDAAFLNFGGSSQTAVAGKKPETWPVAVAGLAPGVVRCRVDLRRGSLSTSRSSGAGYEAGPIVNPRTGRPVEEARVVTVLAADATTADLWSTALVVLGRRGLAPARRAGVEAFLEDPRGVSKTSGFPCRSPTVPKKSGEAS